jgi:hypothetical protein
MAATSLFVWATGPLAFDITNPVKSTIKEVKTKDIAERIRPISERMASTCRTAAEYASLNEGFEDYDGNTTWLPDEWSVVSKDAEHSSPWYVRQPSMFTPGYEGRYAVMVRTDDDEHYDEWLITKAVKVESGEELSFRALLNPHFFYSTKNVDYNAGPDYVGDKIVLHTVKVLVSEDDGETWSVLNDFAESLKDLSYNELLKYPDWNKCAFSLADYEGKTVRFAFEYEGTDSNIEGIDEVTVALPALDVSYTYPAGTQYYGFSKNGSNLSQTVAVLPVFSPLTWSCDTPNPDAIYTWNYMTSDGDMTTATGPDLTVTYGTNFSTELSTRNNFVNPPTVIGSIPGVAVGAYSRGDLVQIGAKPLYNEGGSDDTTSLTNFGLCAFDPYSEEYSFSYAYDYDTPMYGYSSSTDAYWSSYFLGDDALTEGNYAYIDGVINVLQTTNAPIVINGGWVMVVCNNINADHEFTFDICKVNADGTIGDIVASTTAKGSSMQLLKSGFIADYYTLAFEFDHPVVLSSADCDQYAVRYTGIRNCGEYFAPVHSINDSPEGFYHGYVQKVVCRDNTTETSLSSVYSMTDTNTSFAIMLDAEYPWLQCNEDEVVLDNNNTGSLTLNSYYSGEQFVIDAPQWLNVTVTGVNDQCVASFVADETVADANEVDVTLSVPGYSKTISVKNVKSQSGIQSVSVGANREIENYITLSGVSLGGHRPTVPGIYMVRYNDGTVTKVVVK